MRFRRHPEDLTYTIFVGRKLSDGNYGSTEVGIHTQINLPAGTNPASGEAQAAIERAVAATRAQVTDALTPGVPIVEAKRDLLRVFDGCDDPQAQAQAVWDLLLLPAKGTATHIDAADVAQLLSVARSRVEPFEISGDTSAAVDDVPGPGGGKADAPQSVVESPPVALQADP